MHLQLISAILGLMVIQELLYSYLCTWMYFKEITRRRYYFYWNIVIQQQRMTWSVKQVYSPLSKMLWNISINSTKRTDVPCNWHWEMSQRLLDTVILLLDTKYQALLPLSRRNESDLIFCHVINTWLTRLSTTSHLTRVSNGDVLIHFNNRFEHFKVFKHISNV